EYPAPRWTGRGKMVPMPRRWSAELVAESRAAMARAQGSLSAGELATATGEAKRAFELARAQRSHRLVSEAGILLVEVLAADPDRDSTLDYRDHVEGAYYWAETMPEEIQVWFLLALVPHLAALGFRRLVDRAEQRRVRADAWLRSGNLNVLTRL